MRIGAAVSIGLLFVTLGSTAAHAEKEIYLNGGVAFSNLKDDAEVVGQVFAEGFNSGLGTEFSSDMGKRTGFEGGLGFRYSKTGTVGGAIELRYVTRGSKYELVDASGQAPNLTLTWKLNYVEIPVLLWVSPGSGRVRPIISIGPVVDIKASADFELEAAGQSESEPVNEGFKSTAFAGMVGLGARFPVGATSHLEVEARYQLGFTNLIDSADVSFKSTDFSILAGWSWSLGN